MKHKNNLIIIIGREIGSGGRTIARLLAEKYGCQFYDREILNLAAKESGFNEKFFEQNDEKKGIFKSLFHIHVPFISDSCFYDNGLSQESLFKMQSDAIREAAQKGPCVFVGRCADYVLRDFENVVSFFITANIDERIKRVSQRYGYSEQESRKLIENGERQRASYYNYYTGKKWGDSRSYDLCINSSILGIEGTMELIGDFLDKVHIIHNK